LPDIHSNFFPLLVCISAGSPAYILSLSRVSRRGLGVIVSVISFCLNQSHYIHIIIHPEKHRIFGRDLVSTPSPVAGDPNKI